MQTGLLTICYDNVIAFRSALYSSPLVAQALRQSRSISVVERLLGTVKKMSEFNSKSTAGAASSDYIAF